MCSSDLTTEAQTSEKADSKEGEDAKTTEAQTSEKDDCTSTIGDIISKKNEKTRRRIIGWCFYCYHHKS